MPAGNIGGPLHGIPYGAKDLLATSGGIPTTWGAAPFREQVFDYDAAVVRRLEDAGAPLAAKLAMVEIAGGMGVPPTQRIVHGAGDDALGQGCMVRRIVERVGRCGSGWTRAIRHWL